MTFSYDRFEASTHRWMKSRPIAYVVFAFFLIDGGVRLADGRLLRGIANIAVGVGVVYWLLRQPYHDQPRGAAARRQRWIRAHPVLGSVLMGGAWGSAMGTVFFATKEGPLWWALATGVGGGVLLFGPLVTWCLRHSAEDDHPRPTV